MADDLLNHRLILSAQAAESWWWSSRLAASSVFNKEVTTLSKHDNCGVLASGDHVVASRFGTW